MTEGLSGPAVRPEADLSAACDERPEGTRTSLSEVSVVSLIYLVLVLVYLHPVLAAPGELIPGSRFSAGQYGNTVLALPRLGGEHAFEFKIPYYSRMVGHPEGAYCLFAGWPGILLLTLLTQVLPLCLSFNLVLILVFMLAPVAMYLLVRYFVESRTAAFLAGYLYGFALFFVAALTNGQFEQVYHGLMPLTLLFFFRATLGRKGWRDIFLFALFFSATVFSFAYYSLYVLAVTGIWAIGWLVSPSPAGPPFVGGRSWRCERSKMGKRLAGLVLIMALSIGAGWTYYRLLRSVPVSQSAFMPLGMLDRPPIDQETEIRQNFPRTYADLRGLWVPLDHGSLNFSTLGVPLLLLSVFVSVRALRRRRYICVGLMAMFLFLSLGEFVVVGDRILEIAGYRIPTPMYLYQHGLIPPLPQFAPYRFLAAFLLCAALLIGTELSGMVGRGAPVKAGLLGLAVLGSSALELWAMAGTFWPLPTTRVTPPPIYEVIRSDPREIAVMEIPGFCMLEPGSDNRFYPQRYGMFQVYHQKPMVNIPTNIFHDPVAQHPIVAFCLRAAVGQGTGELPPGSVQWSMEWLMAHRVAYLLVHRACLSERAFQTMGACLERRFGTPTRSEPMGSESREILLFRTPERPPAR